MKLVYTIEAEVEVPSLDLYGDGNTPIKSIEELATKMQLWVAAEEIHYLELLDAADSFKFTVKGVE